jgi:hypothetical protein
VSPHYLGFLKFQQAIDLCGKPIVVDLAGANYKFGAERDDHVPVLFHLFDGRIFYGRFFRESFGEFRYRPQGVTCTLQQLSIEGAMRQGELESIPMPPKPTADCDQPSSGSDDAQVDQSVGIYTSSIETQTQRDEPGSVFKSPKSKLPRKPKRAAKADAILEVIEAAIEAEHWGLSPETIAKAADATGRYFRELRKKNPKFQNAYDRYRKASAGRGPARPSEL